MNSKSYFGKIAVAMVVLAAVCVLSVPNVMAASGNMKLDVTVHPTTHLFYYDTLSIDIPGTDLAQMLTGTTGAINRGAHAMATATFGGGALTATLTAPDSTLTTALNNVTLNIENCWAVKALGTTTTMTVTVNTAGGADQLLNGASVIKISSASPSPGSFTPSINTATDGNLSMILDLTGLTVPGNHSTAAGTYQFTITATTV